MNFKNKKYFQSTNDNVLLFIFSDGLIIKSIHSNKMKVIGDLVIKDWWNVQVIPIRGLFIILSFSSNKLIEVNENGDYVSIDVPVFKFPYPNLYKLTDDGQLLFDRGGLGYYIYDFKSKVYSSMRSIIVMKSDSAFRKLDSKLYSNAHTVLYQSLSLEEILYHSYSQNDSSEIGIYSIREGFPRTQFTAPEKIENVNWFTGKKAMNDMNIYSNVLGHVFKDEVILLCYRTSLYLLNFSGKVLNSRQVRSRRRFYGLSVTSSEEIFISELNENNNQIELMNYANWFNLFDQD